MPNTDSIDVLRLYFRLDLEHVGIGNDQLFDFSTADFGKDVVTHFVPNADMLQFSQQVFAVADVAMSHAAQVGSDVVITYDANDSVTLKDMVLANLHASDFHIV